MTALATIEDFEARYGDAPTGAAAFLGDASSLILTEVANSTRQWVTDYSADELPEEPDTVPPAVVGVTVAMAHRALSHPGAGVESERLGAHAVSFKADSSEDAIYLTKQERRTVRSAAGLGSSSAVILQTPYSGDNPSPRENDLPL